MKTLKTLFFLKLLFCLQICFAQGDKKTPDDAEYNKILAKKLDTNQVHELIKFAERVERSDLNKALIYYRKSLQLSTKLDWYIGESLSLNNIGKTFLSLSELDSATIYFNKGIAVNEKNKDFKGQIVGLINLSAFYANQGNHNEASKLIFKALKLSEEIKYPNLIAVSSINLSVLFSMQKQYDKSIVYAQKALDGFKKLGVLVHQAKCHEVIGVAYMQKKNIKLANQNFNEALKLFKQDKNLLGEATIYTQLVANNANNPVIQLSYLQKARTIWEKISPNHPLAIANIGNTGVLYYDVAEKHPKMHVAMKLSKEQLLDSAEKYLTAGLNLSKQFKVPSLISTFSKGYADVFASRAKYKEAYNGLKEYVSAQDTFYSQEIKNKIAALETQREVGIRDKQLQLKKLEVRELWLYGVIVVIVIIAIAFILINRSRIRQLRLKNLLQKREAKEQAKELIHQNKLSETELKAIRSQMNPHFIFNVLNSIEAYIVENEPKMAARLVQKFASLSRLILENSTQSLVTADREWKALKLYTELEAMRFNGQFAYEFELDESLDLPNLMIPPMLVQPLIENAIHHGLRNSTATDNLIKLKVNDATTHIDISVADNGIGIEESNKFKDVIIDKNKSFGLSAIKERIKMMNALQNEQAVFEIKAVEDGGRGTIAKIILPKLYRN
ncbi:MAG: tetratricopeptide repeat protein [Pedobacter sp.]|nr:MAG: tetratricopeptide repeat protein [Pedobacter sp.]